MKKILLIEDNNDIRENFTEFLEMSGYEVYATNDGKKGIELAMKIVPDLIICDIVMTAMDGYEILRLLSGSPKTYQIPFIFSTSKSEKSDYAEAMKLGADDYIVKPFDMEILLNKIENCLRSNISKHQNDKHIDYNNIDPTESNTIYMQ
jgi:DNA-binding response OmpR family regulator